MPEESHVSSLIVHVQHDRVNALRAKISGMPGAEIHAVERGKMIVTLETANEGEIVARLNEISLCDGVMSAALVYHHVERANQAGDLPCR